VAGLPLNLRVYDLRHAFVTLSLVAGVDPKTVSREAGHASVAFTLDHYGHVLEEQYEEAGLKRAELFAQRGKVLAK
jgi:site-specific recombinase XerD